MESILKIFTLSAVILLSSINIFTADQSGCSEHKDILCLSALCLASSACTLGGAMLTVQSASACLQVAPAAQCLAGACTTCACGYVAIGLIDEFRYHVPKGSGCCGFGKKVVSAHFAGLIQAPAQQTMEQVPNKGTKLQ